MKFLASIIWLVASGLVCAEEATLIAPSKKVDFAKDVWPILEAKCVQCHMDPYVDPKTGNTIEPKGNLLLYTAKDIMKAAHANSSINVKPGDANSSPLYVVMREGFLLDRAYKAKKILPKADGLLTKEQEHSIRKLFPVGTRFGPGDMGSLPPLDKPLSENQQKMFVAWIKGAGQMFTSSWGINAMPPPKKEPLTEMQLATVKAWIDSGAKFGNWERADLTDILQKLGAQ